MSGPGKPRIFTDTVAYHEIRLRCLYHEEEDAPHEFTIWGRPDDDGWFGWLRKEHIPYQVPVIWLKGVYEQVK